MASTVIGTVQNKFTFSTPTGNSAALHSPGQYVFSGFPMSLTQGSVLLTLPAPTNETNQCVLKFHAKKTGGGDGSGQKSQVRVWGGRRQPRTGVTDDYSGTYLFTLETVTGTKTVNVSSFGGSGPYNLVTQVNILDDQTNTPPGLRLVGTVAGGDGWVEVIFDTTGYSFLVVELTNIDTTDVGFVWSTL